MLWHGMTISGVWRLFRSKPALHWSRFFRIVSLPLTGVFNSVFKALETLVYGRRIEKTEVKEPPLFVLGYWRSGTTLLQTLLSKDPNFQHLPLYRTLFPWHFLLTEKIVTKLTAPFVPKSRPMDNMSVSWDAPQEDDVSLCIMSQISHACCWLIRRSFRTSGGLLNLTSCQPKTCRRGKTVFACWSRN